MPYLQFKGFDPTTIQQLSPELVDEFSQIANDPKESVKIEVLEVTNITPNPPAVEISMFERPQEKHDEIVRHVLAMLHRYGYENVHIFFTIFSRCLYYIDGKSLKQ